MLGELEGQRLPCLVEVELCMSPGPGGDRRTLTPQEAAGNGDPANPSGAGSCCPQDAPSCPVFGELGSTWRGDVPQAAGVCWEGFCVTGCQHSPPTAASALLTGLRESCCTKWLPNTCLAPAASGVGSLGSISAPLKPGFSFHSHRGWPCFCLLPP